MIPATAVLVTRGDVPLEPILASLAVFDEVIVWNNADREDLKCYGRFAGAREARNDLIYVQDDDAIVPVEALYEEWFPAAHRVMMPSSINHEWIVANKQPEEEWRFLGLGAFFDRKLLAAFDPYLAAYPEDADFYRAADIVFAYSNPYTSVWVGYDELEWARAPNRMYLQPGHYEVRELLRARTLALPERI